MHVDESGLNTVCTPVLFFKAALGWSGFGLLIWSGKGSKEGLATVGRPGSSV